MFKALIQITCYRANLEKSEQSQYWESHYNIFDYLVQRWRSLKRAQPTRLKSICQSCDKKSRCSWSSQQSRAETEKQVKYVETLGACEGGWSWMSSGIGNNYIQGYIFNIVLSLGQTDRPIDKVSYRSSLLELRNGKQNFLTIMPFST